ncbi:MAG: hypothetical protein ABL999_06550 [Pyrinomonadaceae bacterium]
MCGLLILSGYAASAQTPAVSECLFTGTVFNLQDAVLSGSLVILRSAEAAKSTVADEGGKFRIKLVPGIYEPLIAQGLNVWNYMRSPINISCNSDTSLNLYIMPECVSNGCSRIGSNFDVFTKNGKIGKSKDPKLVIAYFERQKRAKNIVYYNAISTFGSFTIQAKEISFDRKTRKLVARNGWIEDGLSRQSFDERTVDIADSLLRSDFKLTTTSDMANARRLKKIYLDLKEAKIVE